MTEAYSATGAAWQHGPGRVYDRLAEAVVAASPVPLSGRTVLDLGAGTGAATRAIGAAGGTSIATDLALGMLQAIEPTVPSAVADARALPFPDRSLDGVVAAFALNHVPDPHHAITEATRVSRRGSPILVSAYASDDTHPVKDAVNAAAAELGWQPDAWIDALRTTTMPILASIDRARRVAREAGLPDAEARRLDVAFPELGAEDLVALALRHGTGGTVPRQAQPGAARPASSSSHRAARRGATARAPRRCDHCGGVTSVSLPAGDPAPSPTSDAR